MSVGVNDLDIKSPRLLFTSIRVTVELLRRKFPGIRVILSEITPRNDKLDNQVKEVNYMINAYAKKCDDIFTVIHSNMRNPDFFSDERHFIKSIIPRFASNIKMGLKRAYGNMNTQYQKRESKEALNSDL